jgi:Holliday junction DNA helicase RuvA
LYDYLEGRVSARKPAGLVLDVGGVGYDLAVPPGSAFAESAPLRVWTHLIVREDAHLLYGFPNAAMRDLFRTLLSVRGVGPAVALGIVSGLPREELVATILAEDIAPLVRLRGVGKKTAEQILLDLRDKATLLAAELPADERRGLSRPAASEEERRVEDAVGALVSIGYPEKEARRQVRKAALEVDATDLELLVRTALMG